MRRRKWYHVSSVDHGPTMSACRRGPVLRCASEPATPRVCVCPELAGCLSAVLLQPGRAYVYAVERRAVAPKGVWDAAITGERWLVPPVELVLVRVLEPYFVRDAQAAALLRAQAKRASTWRTRVAQFVVAARMTGERPGLAARWARMLGRDPEEEILTWR